MAELDEKDMQVCQRCTSSSHPLLTQKLLQCSYNLSLLKDSFSETATQVVYTTSIGKNMNSKLLWVAIIWSSGLSRCCVSGGYFFRKYELESFESKDIADYMLIGDDGNGLPESLHGLWWMDGNNVPEEVLSFGGSIWHENSRSVVISVYDEGTWTWADSTPGRFIYRFMQGLSRSTLVFKFSEDLQTAEITSGYQLFGLMFMIPRFWLLFSMYFVEDGLWVREESSLFIFDIGSYKLRRIVNATGHPTDAFDDFLASAPQNLLIARRPR